MSRTIARDSSFELLRLLAQFFIVFYHMLMITAESSHLGNGVSVSKALWIPLHIGVPIFVMISGYFGIRSSIKGFLKLLITVFFYVLVTNIIMYCINGGGNFPFSKLLIVSSSHWFVRTYIYLYLFSPVLNAYNKKADGQQMLYLLLILLFINVYVGFIGKDISLIEGKNLTNFCLFYVIGSCISRWKHIFSRISSKWYLVTFVFLNLILCTAYSCLSQGASNIIWKLSFPYHSPFILVSSTLFIYMFSNLQMRSKSINRIARSTFAIYLLHCSGLVMNYVNKPVLQQIVDHYNSSTLIILSLFAYSIILFIACIAIDQLLMPMWNRIHRQLDKRCKTIDLSV